jgi:hypothetical protein
MNPETPPRKPRSDCLLKNLSAEQQEAIADYGATHSIAETKTRPLSPLNRNSRVGRVIPCAPSHVPIQRRARSDAPYLPQVHGKMKNTVDVFPACHQNVLPQYPAETN